MIRSAMNDIPKENWDRINWKDNGEDKHLVLPIDSKSSSRILPVEKPLQEKRST